MALQSIPGLIPIAFQFDSRVTLVISEAFGGIPIRLRRPMFFRYLNGTKSTMNLVGLDQGSQDG